MVSNRKHVLVAPLDWGLGHTTRCIPLISYISGLGHHVTFAGNQSQRSYIEETFGNIETIHLEGYNIRYSRWNRFAQVGLLSQLPGLKRTIADEYRWLQKIVHDQRIDGIISDNRYGLFHDTIPSVILTHQLQVLSGSGSVGDAAARKVQYSLLKKFRNIWIVDAPGNTNLAGKLSHPHTLPANSNYVGLLSRFTPATALTNSDARHLLILISGPEPQRTEFSDMLWQQAIQYNGQITFVEGSEKSGRKNIPGDITYCNRVAHRQLEPLLQSADMVISRSGYSTLMDLVALRKKAILIPTPGQPEQQYLAKYLQQQGRFYSAPQKNFNFAEALRNADAFAFIQPHMSGAFHQHEHVINDWLQAL